MAVHFPLPQSSVLPFVPPQLPPTPPKGKAINCFLFRVSTFAPLLSDFLQFVLETTWKGALRLHMLHRFCASSH
ncbi:hypothetical protein HAX54_024981 [Datura stramonium]|uniref:Uncharacterized protein n=1 Tax=Datura stramonium TaxID=4076 RepID=A0ABS8V0P6_DATST|nr:hypothetical protein [Datura stramonium]